MTYKPSKSGQTDVDFGVWTSSSAGRSVHAGLQVSARRRSRDYLWGSNFFFSKVDYLF